MLDFFGHHILHRVGDADIASIYNTQADKFSLYLNAAAVGRQSTAIVVCGSDERVKLTDAVISNSNGIHNADCVKISGLSSHSDSHAFLQIADKFLHRDNSEKNSNIVLEDLECYFQQRKHEGIPAIIIIDHLEEFVKRDKQILLYTLLDLLHKSDMFFILIGMTSHMNLNMMMEKRVSSRFTAQYIYLPHPNSDMICSYLAKQLYISENDMSILIDYMKSYISSFNDDKNVTDDKNTLSVTECINEYNQSVIQLFGSIESTTPNAASISSTLSVPNTETTTTTTSSNVITDNISTTIESIHSGSKGSTNNTMGVKGELYHIISLYSQWGYSISWFNEVTKSMIMSLIIPTLSLHRNLNIPGIQSFHHGNDKNINPIVEYIKACIPKLKSEYFEIAISVQQPSTLLDLVSSLSSLEIYLLGAACRLHMEPNRKANIKGLCHILDQFTGILTRKEMSIEMIYIAIQQLCHTQLLYLSNAKSTLPPHIILDICHISPQTNVYLIHSPVQIQELFRSHVNMIQLTPVQQIMTTHRNTSTTTNTTITSTSSDDNSNTRSNNTTATTNSSNMRSPILSILGKRQLNPDVEYLRHFSTFIPQTNKNKFLQKYQVESSFNITTNSTNTTTTAIATSSSSSSSSSNKSPTTTDNNDNTIFNYSIIKGKENIHTKEDNNQNMIDTNDAIYKRHTSTSTTTTTATATTTTRNRESIRPSSHLHVTPRVREYILDSTVPIVAAYTHQSII